VEFECIDIIYERNVKNRIIKQACLSYDEFLEKLNGSECIAIKDIGQESLTAYDWLLGSGLTNICLLTNEENDNGQRFMMKSHCTIETDMSKNIKMQLSSIVRMSIVHWAWTAWII